MSQIRNRARSPLFNLMTIDLEKCRGKWRILIGDKKVGKTYQRKVQAIRAARRIRKAWAMSLADAQSDEVRLMELLELQFAKIARLATESDRLDCLPVEDDAPQSA